MKLIPAQDREHIENKYHLKDQPYNSLNRWAYHGYDYDPSTGLTDGEIQAGLTALAAQTDGEPRPVQKAKLVEYVLENTRIDVNEHDYFVGFYTWGRPITEHCISKWYKDLCDKFPETAKQLGEINASGMGSGGLDFDHTIPDWDSMMELGYPGLLTRITARYEELKAAGRISERQEDFFRGVEIEYKAIIRFIDRLYRYALTKDFEKAPKIAQCLKNLRDGAPKTMYDAMQLIYLHFMISESIDNYQVRSLGYGLDATLYPFFINDIASGVATAEEEAELLSYFLMQWSAIDNYWGQPFYMAGMYPDGSTRVNEMSYLILDVYDRMGLFNPKIQIKVNGSTPKEFVLRALEMIRGGNSSIVFLNDDVIANSLISRGATYEEAVDSAVSGCYEYRIKNRTYNIGGGTLNMLKPLSLVFDNGYDEVAGVQMGPQTGDVTKFTTFGQFYEAYRTQLRSVVERIIEGADVLQTRVQDVNPSLLYSATIPSCVERMADAPDYGMDNDSAINCSGFATTVDALMAVYELVFEKKVCTMAELKDALDKNWEGCEILRAKALKCRKFGNNEPMSDAYARALNRYLACDLIAGKRNSHGGAWLFEMHSARFFIIYGSKTKATPDGRRFGEEVSKNVSPTPGMDRSGVTALINSATCVDPQLDNEGFCLDVMLHPSAVQGKDGLEAFWSVLKTYLEKGGASIHFNIFSAEILRDAQKHPEKYKNLQVRVCGWNVLWNNMVKSEQDAYILRAENI